MMEVAWSGRTRIILVLSLATEINVISVLDYCMGTDKSGGKSQIHLCTYVDRAIDLCNVE